MHKNTNGESTTIDQFAIDPIEALGQAKDYVSRPGFEDKGGVGTFSLFLLLKMEV